MPKHSLDTSLYPTVAVSDLVNAAGHAYGAYVCYSSNPNAAIGLLYVAAAAAVGVLRFGFNGKLFAPANGAWAEVAGFIGLPLVGHASLQRLLLGTPALLTSATTSQLVTFLTFLFQPSAYLSMLVLMYVAFKGYCSEAGLSAARTGVAFTGFVLPLVVDGVLKGNYMLVSSVVLFLIAGIVVGADRHRYLVGVRRENWFHYLIAAAAVGIGSGLSLTRV